ncbi:hypothetical protein ACHAPT_006224 [Fusarium lateritium]
MRSEILALPLLALGRGVLASPCVPHSSSSSLAVTTTASSSSVSTDSTESTTILTTSESATESTTATSSTALSTASTESTTVLTTTDSTTVSVTESTTATTSTAPSTASTESTIVLTTAGSTTTSAIESTTSTEPEPQVTNLLSNGGFEGNIPDPWKLYSPDRNLGMLSIATDRSYEGSQSGYFEFSENDLDEHWGIYQSIDKSLLTANERYLVTLRIRVPPGTCDQVYVVPSYTDRGFMTMGQVQVPVSNAVNNWLEIMTIFRYSQQAINAGAGIAIISQCRDSVSFWVDDVAINKYVEPTTD